MSSLLLGFFACSSSTHRSRILSLIRQSDFSACAGYVQEFLFLQSDSQLLHEEGLEAMFRMLESLRRMDRSAAAAAATAAAAETATHMADVALDGMQEMKCSNGADRDEDEDEQSRSNKKARVEHQSSASASPSSPPAALLHSRLSFPSALLSPPSSFAAAATFDQLFSDSQRDAHANGNGNSRG